MSKFEYSPFPDIEHLVDDPAKTANSPIDLRLMDYVVNMVAYGFKGVDAHIGNELELNIALALCRGINARNYRPETATMLFRDISHYTNRRFLSGNLMVRAPKFGQIEPTTAGDCSVWDEIYTESLSSPAGCAEEMVRTLTINEQMLKDYSTDASVEDWLTIGCRAWVELQADLEVIDNAESRFRPGEIQE